MLEASNISLNINKQAILKAVSARFPKGEITGIIGPNGAGKSTLLRLLVGLQAADSGEVLLQQQPLQQIASAELAKKISYLPQTPECHWPLLVERVVALGRFPHQTSAHLKPNDIESIKRACKAADIEHLLGRPINRLSGGEKARVMFARALATEADILLADEPIASLDPGHQLELMALFKSLAEMGKTIVLVLHELHFVMRYCDQLILLDKGAKVAEGKPEQVLSSENLAKSYAIECLPGQYQGQQWLLPWNTL